MPPDGLPARRRFVARSVPALVVALVLPASACLQTPPARALLLPEGRAPLADHTRDRDRDGLLDADEDELAARYAPIVILHRQDHARPASVGWLLSRNDLFETPEVALAGAAGLRRAARGARKSGAWRSGSDDPADWTTYVHVYPRGDDGINVQYWFFYPYNDGPLFFDHDSDWEHVTVRLDPRGEPLSIELAQHENDSPGVSVDWRRIQRDGEHPIVFSASGTHASYAHGHRIAWFEKVAACNNLEGCAHPIWRTWQGGGLQNLGERGRAMCHERELAFSQRWGASGLIPGTSAPFGPHHHRAYCTDGARSCVDPPLGGEALEAVAATPTGDGSRFD